MVIMAVPVEMIIRGLDYLLPGTAGTPQLSIVEAAMPMVVWGSLCLLAGATGLVGFLGRWRRITAVGLWVGGVTYTALAVGQWWAVSGYPWLDGVRGPAVVTLLAIAQLGMSVGYAQQPDDVAG